MGRIVGRIANGYAVPAARLYIHNVISRGKGADVFQIGAGAQQSFVHLDLVYNQRLSVGAKLKEFLSCEFSEKLYVA